MAKMSQMTPVSARERVATLDVLRGFALCGVLIANLYWAFSGRIWLRPPPDGALDVAANWLEDIFVSSKAQTMLTFLFGFGFAAQLLRAQRRGEPVMGVYLRRLFVLLGIGALHVALLWWGDVTWGYALAGFALLGFQRTTNRTRLVWAAILVFVPQVVMHIPAVRAAVGSPFTTPDERHAVFASMEAAARGPSFTATMPAHIRFALTWQGPIYAWYYAWILGRFLIGYVAGTQGWFDRDGADHLALFRRLLRWGLAGAAAATAWNLAHRLGVLTGYELTTAGELAVSALHEIGLLGLTAAYMAVIVLLMQRPAWRRVLQLVAPAGRMPLTTYISQSVICTALFYGWGLGWAGRIRGPGQLGIAVAIFALQVAACHLWLRRFRFGPLEWVWRTLVYLTPQPMRVTPPAATAAAAGSV